MGPPTEELGGFVPVRVVLARSGEHLVTMGPMLAYSSGVELTLEFRARVPFVGPMFRPETGPGAMRFGVAFSDGRRTTDAQPPPFDREPSEDDGPVLMPRGGGGGNGLYRQDMWLWPLPPPGPVIFAFDWEAAGIAETVVEIEGSRFRDAAATAERLWEPLSADEEEAARRALMERASSMPGRHFSLRFPRRPPSAEAPPD